MAPDGRWLASAGDDQTVRIRDVATMHTQARMRVDGYMFACAWLGSDALVVGGSAGLYVFGFLTETKFGLPPQGRTAATSGETASEQGGPKAIASTQGWEWEQPCDAAVEWLGLTCRFPHCAGVDGVTRWPPLHRGRCIDQSVRCRGRREPSRNGPSSGLDRTGPVDKHTIPLSWIS